MHCRRPSIRPPVSSKCATSAHSSCARISSKNPSSPAAPCGHARLQAADRDRRGQPVRQELSRALARQVLIGDQVDPQRPDPRAIAHRRARLGGKARGAQLPATRAEALLDPVLHAAKPRQLGQIQHLARVRIHDRLPRQVAPRTHSQRSSGCTIVIVGNLTTLQMMTRMPRLTARLATRPPPQTALLSLLHRLLRHTHPRTAAWTSYASSDPAARAAPRSPAPARRSAPRGSISAACSATSASSSAYERERGASSVADGTRARFPASRRDPAPRLRRPTARTPDCPPGPLSNR